jgi:hypothetical protein
LRTKDSDCWFGFWKGFLGPKLAFFFICKIRRNFS